MKQNLRSYLQAGIRQGPSLTIWRHPPAIPGKRMRGASDHAPGALSPTLDDGAEMPASSIVYDGPSHTTAYTTLSTRMAEGVPDAVG